MPRQRKKKSTNDTALIIERHYAVPDLVQEEKVAEDLLSVLLKIRDRISLVKTPGSISEAKDTPMIATM